MDLKPSAGRTLRPLVLISILVILAPATYGLVSYLFSQGEADSEPFLERPSSKYEECVRDTIYMRFHHMELLREVREQVVREGIRGEITLDRCRECHSNRGRFCNRCHESVSLNVDCFGCHYYPDQPDDLRAGR